MNHPERAIELNRVDGNTLCIKEKGRKKVKELLNDTHCKNCGRPEEISYFPKYTSSLTDGLCYRCEAENGN